MPNEQHKVLAAALHALIARRIELAKEIVVAPVGIDDRAKRLSYVQEGINALRKALAGC
jgi:hypothetical protein